MSSKHYQEIVQRIKNRADALLKGWEELDKASAYMLARPIVEEEVKTLDDDEILVALALEVGALDGVFNGRDWRNEELTARELIERFIITEICFEIADYYKKEGK